MIGAAAGSVGAKRIAKRWVHMLRTVKLHKADQVWGVRDKFVAAIDKPRIGALPGEVRISSLHAPQKAEHRRRRPSEESNVDVEKRSAFLWRHVDVEKRSAFLWRHRWRHALA